MANINPIQFYVGGIRQFKKLPLFILHVHISVLLMIHERFFPGTVIILALSLLAPYFYYIPRTTLAAVLIAAVSFMIDWKILNTLWKCNSK